MTTKSKNPVIVEKVEQIKQSHVPIVGTDESKKNLKIQKLEKRKNKTRKHFNKKLKLQQKK